MRRTGVVQGLRRRTSSSSSSVCEEGDRGRVGGVVLLSAHAHGDDGCAVPMASGVGDQGTGYEELPPCRHVTRTLGARSAKFSLYHVDAATMKGGCNSGEGVGVPTAPALYSVRKAAAEQTMYPKSSKMANLKLKLRRKSSSDSSSPEPTLTPPPLPTARSAPGSKDGVSGEQNGPVGTIERKERRRLLGSKTLSRSMENLFKRGWGTKSYSIDIGGPEVGTQESVIPVYDEKHRPERLKPKATSGSKSRLQLERRHSLDNCIDEIDMTRSSDNVNQMQKSPSEVIARPRESPPPVPMMGPATRRLRSRSLDLSSQRKLILTSINIEVDPVPSSTDEGSISHVGDIMDDTLHSNHVGTDSGYHSIHNGHHDNGDAQDRINSDYSDFSDSYSEYSNTSSIYNSSLYSNTSNVTSDHLYGNVATVFPMTSSGDVVTDHVYGNMPAVAAGSRDVLGRTAGCSPEQTRPHTAASHLPVTTATTAAALQGGDTSLVASPRSGVHRPGTRTIPTTLSRNDAIHQQRDDGAANLTPSGRTPNERRAGRRPGAAPVVSAPRQEEGRGTPKVKVGGREPGVSVTSYLTAKTLARTRDLFPAGSGTGLSSPVGVVPTQEASQAPKRAVVVASPAPSPPAPSRSAHLAGASSPPKPPPTKPQQTTTGTHTPTKPQPEVTTSHTTTSPPGGARRGRTGRRGARRGTAVVRPSVPPPLAPGGREAALEYGKETSIDAVREPEEQGTNVDLLQTLKQFDVIISDDLNSECELEEEEEEEDVVVDIRGQGEDGYYERDGIKWEDRFGTTEKGESTGVDGIRWGDRQRVIAKSVGDTQGEVFLEGNTEGKKELEELGDPKKVGGRKEAGAIPKPNETVDIPAVCAQSVQSDMWRPKGTTETPHSLAPQSYRPFKRSEIGAPDCGVIINTAGKSTVELLTPGHGGCHIGDGTAGSVAVVDCDSGHVRTTHSSEGAAGASSTPTVGSHGGVLQQELRSHIQHLRHRTGSVGVPQVKESAHNKADSEEGPVNGEAAPVTDATNMFHHRKTAPPPPTPPKPSTGDATVGVRATPGGATGGSKAPPSGGLGLLHGLRRVINRHVNADRGHDAEGDVPSHAKVQCHNGRDATALTTTAARGRCLRTGGGGRRALLPPARPLSQVLGGGIGESADTQVGSAGPGEVGGGGGGDVLVIHGAELGSTDTDAPITTHSTDATSTCVVSAPSVINNRHKPIVPPKTARTVRRFREKLSSSSSDYVRSPSSCSDRSLSPHSLSPERCLSRTAETTDPVFVGCHDNAAEVTLAQAQRGLEATSAAYIRSTTPRGFSPTSRSPTRFKFNIGRSGSMSRSPSRDGDTSPSGAKSPDITAMYAKVHKMGKAGLGEANVKPSLVKADRHEDNNNLGHNQTHANSQAVNAKPSTALKRSNISKGNSSSTVNLHGYKPVISYLHGGTTTPARHQSQVKQQEFKQPPPTPLKPKPQVCNNNTNNTTTQPDSHTKPTLQLANKPDTPPKVTLVNVKPSGSRGVKRQPSCSRTLKRSPSGSRTIKRRPTVPQKPRNSFLKRLITSHSIENLLSIGYTGGGDEEDEDGSGRVVSGAGQDVHNAVQTCSVTTPTTITNGDVTIIDDASPHGSCYDDVDVLLGGLRARTGTVAPPGGEWCTDPDLLRASVGEGSQCSTLLHTQSDHTQSPHNTATTTTGPPTGSIDITRVISARIPAPTALSVHTDSTLSAQSEDGGTVSHSSSGLYEDIAADLSASSSRSRRHRRRDQYEEVAVQDSDDELEVSDDEEDAAEPSRPNRHLLLSATLPAFSRPEGVYEELPDPEVLSGSGRRGMEDAGSERHAHAPVARVPPFQQRAYDEVAIDNDGTPDVIDQPSDAIEKPAKPLSKFALLMKQNKLNLSKFNLTKKSKSGKLKGSQSSPCISSDASNPLGDSRLSAGRSSSQKSDSNSDPSCTSQSTSLQEDANSLNSYTGSVSSVGSNNSDVTRRRHPDRRLVKSMYVDNADPDDSEQLGADGMSRTYSSPDSLSVHSGSDSASVSEYATDGEAMTQHDHRKHLAKVNQKINKSLGAKHLSKLYVATIKEKTATLKEKTSNIRNLPKYFSKSASSLNAQLQTLAARKTLGDISGQMQRMLKKTKDKPPAPAPVGKDYSSDDCLDDGGWSTDEFDDDYTEPTIPHNNWGPRVPVQPIPQIPKQYHHQPQQAQADYLTLTADVEESYLTPPTEGTTRPGYLDQKYHTRNSGRGAGSGDWSDQHAEVKRDSGIPPSPPQLSPMMAARKRERRPLPPTPMDELSQFHQLRTEEDDDNDESEYMEPTDSSGHQRDSGYCPPLPPTARPPRIPPKTNGNGIRSPLDMNNEQYQADEDSDGSQEDYEPIDVNMGFQKFGSKSRDQRPPAPLPSRESPFMPKLPRPETKDPAANALNPSYLMNARSGLKKTSGTIPPPTPVKPTTTSSKPFPSSKPSTFAKPNNSKPNSFPKPSTAPKPMGGNIAERMAQIQLRNVCGSPQQMPPKTPAKPPALIGPNKPPRSPVVASAAPSWQHERYDDMRTMPEHAGSHPSMTPSNFSDIKTRALAGAVQMPTLPGETKSAGFVPKLKPHNTRPGGKIALRPPTTTSSSCPTPAVLPQSASQTPPRQPQKANPASDLDGLYSYFWFHGSVPRNEVSERLFSVNMDGAYMVRRSNKGDPANPFTLSLLCNDKVWNLHIRLRPDKSYALGNYKDNEKTFASVPELVEYHSHRNLVLAGSRGGETTLKQCPASARS